MSGDLRLRVRRLERAKRAALVARLRALRVTSLRFPLGTTLSIADVLAKVPDASAAALDELEAALDELEAVP